MQILHVIPSVSPLRGGPSFVVRSLATHLARAGVRVEIATTNDNDAGTCLLAPLNQPVKEENYTVWYFQRQTGFYTASWPLSQWLTRHVSDFDVVHIHGLFSFATVSAAFWARRSKVPYIVRPLGTLNRWGMKYRRPMLKALSFRLIERQILNNATYIHFTSLQERDEALELGIVGKSCLIPLGIDVTEFENLPSPSEFFQDHQHLIGKRLLLFMSRVDAKKGLDLLLRAMQTLSSAYPELHLLIAGQGDAEYVKSLAKLASGLGIADKVTWLGFISGAQKMQALAAAEVFILPSHSENFGVAVIEAMAAGLPVVISDQLGISEDVSELQAGLIVKAEPTHIGEAILSLLLDPARRNQLGENAQHLVSDRFSMDITASRLIQIYRAVAR